MINWKGLRDLYEASEENFKKKEEKENTKCLDSGSPDSNHRCLKEVGMLSTTSRHSVCK
jgi:hypothetical protein